MLQRKISAMFFFDVYGVKLSSNVRIPWFNVSAFSLKKSDWHVNFSSDLDDSFFTEGTELPFYISSSLDSTLGVPNLIITTNKEQQLYHLSFSDGVDVLINNLTSHVTFNYPQQEILEYELSYFTASIMSFALLLRGVFSFHASAVAVDNRAIIILGDSGTGKSTMAAAFAKLGYPVLSDDLVVFRENNDDFWVQPAFPLIRLWSKSVEALFGHPAALPEIVPNHPTWHKQYLDLRKDEYKFQDCELPLVGIYFLSPRQSEIQIPGIEPINSKEALLRLSANNYSAQFIDKVTRIKEFKMLGSILGRIPARRILQGDDISHIFKICELILEDFEEISGKEYTKS